MVVRVNAHFFEVVVLAAHAQALLGVGDARMFDRLVAQEQILERIHPTDEHEGRSSFTTIGAEAGVVLLLEKVQKCLADDA